MRRLRCVTVHATVTRRETSRKTADMCTRVPRGLFAGFFNPCTCHGAARFTRSARAVDREKPHVAVINNFYGSAFSFSSPFRGPPSRTCPLHVGMTTMEMQRDVKLKCRRSRARCLDLIENKIANSSFPNIIIWLLTEFNRAFKSKTNLPLY